MKKKSLKEYLKKEEVFNPETVFEILPDYQLMNIFSFLSRNDKMILDMSLERDRFRSISEEELLIAREETEASIKEDEYNSKMELPDLYLERCDNDFTIFEEFD